MALVISFYQLRCIILSESRTTSGVLTDSPIYYVTADDITVSTSRQSSGQPLVHVSVLLVKRDEAGGSSAVRYLVVAIRPPVLYCRVS